MSVQKDSSVRVRFAPSPTGNLHIGGLRTALFNYLFAKHHGGTFLLRVEDTDKERSKQEFTDAQLASLAWCKIESDEPLVYQSQRADAYQEVIDKLLSEGKAYRCVCTDVERQERALKAGHTDQFYGYDEFCRERNYQADSEKPFVIRFAVPKECTEIVVEDLIRGTVTFKRDQFDDFIIARSDGSPMYNFVVVIDDNFMKVTHVIRGEEHLVNTPKQILLAQACGFEIPQFAHIPLILSPTGGKLSKRDAAVDVLQYKREGYLPDALVNYVVRLGWAHGDQEVFTRQELIDCFTLKGVGKKGAVFDTDKLNWLNKLYIGKLTPRECLDWMNQDVCSLSDQGISLSNDKLKKIVALYQERVNLGIELCGMVMGLCKAPKQYHEEAIQKWLNADVIDHLRRLQVQLEELQDFDSEVIKSTIKHYCTEHEIKLGMLAQPLRIALTGGTESPGVFDLLAVLGKEETVKRINHLVESDVVK